MTTRGEGGDFQGDPNAPSMTDMRSEADAAMGPPPDHSDGARAAREAQAAAMADPDRPANMDDGQTAPGFEAEPTEEPEVSPEVPEGGLSRELQALAEPTPIRPEAPEPEEPPPAGDEAPPPGDDTAPDADAPPPGDDDAEQGSYLPPDVPDGHFNAPHADTFANGTWQIALAQFVKLTDEVLALDEFANLRPFTIMPIWHRKGSPKHPWQNLDGDFEPMLARADIVDERDRWVVTQGETPDALPDIYLALFYSHFEALREKGLFYHGDAIKMHIHIALSSISAENGILGKRVPDLVVQSLHTIRRHGLYSDGLRRVQVPMLPLMENDILRRPGFDIDAPEA